MTLKSYIDLYVLLKHDTTTPQERRAFGLSHDTIKNDPIAQLKVWHDTHIQKLQRPLLSERIDSFLYSVTLILLVLAFIFGIFSGVALLNYNGHEPVNLVYFLAMVVFLPLVTIILTLFSMFGANHTKNLLVHISPAFWMEKLISFFSKGASIDPESFRMNPMLANWIIIKRSQMVALVFSVGLFLALLGVVATRDVAFAWSTTLDVTPEAFHHFTQLVAFPWRSWMPSAVPTLELVEQSHYFRLGGKVSPIMIDHASMLGAWWKFLAMATLFYAIFLRFLVYLLSVWGVRRALRQALITLDGVSRLLQEMNEPLITTHEEKQQESENLSSDIPEDTHARLEHHYDMIQGWSIDRQMLSVLADTFNVSASGIDEVGGNNTLEADQRVIDNTHGSVLLFVKSWEPPTMDFMDYLQALIPKSDKIVVFPVGTSEAHFKPASKSVKVWVRKLASLESDTVEVKV